jgi:hypothetical protein
VPQVHVHGRAIAGSLDSTWRLVIGRLQQAFVLAFGAARRNQINVDGIDGL